MNEITQFWIGVASNVAVVLGLIVVWTRLKSYVKAELEDIENKVTKNVEDKIKKDGDDIMDGHQKDYDEHSGEIKGIKESIDKSNKKYADRKKFVDDRHKIDKDQNDKEHDSILNRLESVVGTVRMNAKVGSAILRILLPMANGNGKEVKDLADEVDEHLRNKI